MDATLIALAALWGATTGLLVPRAAYRLSVEPEEAWRDACPQGHALLGPARGWLGGARCRTCALTVPAATAPAPGPRDVLTADADADGVTDEGRPVPRTVPLRTTPAVPLVLAAACAALAASTGFRPELGVWLLCAPFAALLATVDLRVHRLPDQLTLPLAALVPPLLGAAALLPGAAGSFGHALLGGLVLGAAYFLLFVINPSGMGFGDVKLALPLGALLGWYGWTVLFAGAFAGFLLGGAYGLGLVLLRKADRKSAIPFGPFMIGGALLGLLLGAP
ncbi:A24 family peptidase [Streptomyces sp. WAC08241]|uniref:prepilin peptidase n=1 Tax=Streptomyces sp. WAC08241 TaxID=2487421 RepID=UPI000F78286E|nr:A24 family peptidase [Streptomyces sp. WAC08241]RSS31888.1 prepilin peptidase [Streptomyces sp. WAC08241]